MRIITKGRIPVRITKLYQHVCDNCGTLFEYSIEEMRGVRPILNYYIGYLDCPLCGNTTQILREE
jgi:transcription elongation factor Elf1